jgi:hypothetical protein
LNYIKWLRSTTGNASSFGCRRFVSGGWMSSGCVWVLLVFTGLYYEMGQGHFLFHPPHRIIHWPGHKIALFDANRVTSCTGYRAGPNPNLTGQALTSYWGSVRTELVRPWPPTRVQFSAGTVMSRPVPRPMYTSANRTVRCVKLTTHLHLFLKLRMGGASYPRLPHTFVALCLGLGSTYRIFFCP